MITQKELQEVLHYDAETGLFTWLVSNSNRVKVGGRAGSKMLTGYTQLRLNSKQYLAHRLAWLYVYGEMPENEIDHINGIRNDNRLCNLRKATHYENIRNTGMYTHNTSGYRGVYLRKDTNKWQCQIKLFGKHISLGCYNTAIEASKVYEEYVIKNYGVFHRLTVEQPL